MSKTNPTNQSRRNIGPVACPLICRRGESPLDTGIIEPTAGRMPPGPYCRWQDRFPAAAIRDQVQNHREAAEGPLIATLSTWSIAWNDDPQPLIVLTQMRQQGLIDAIAVRTPPQDPHCVLPLLATGFVDAIATPMNLLRQQPAAALLPMAAETQTAVVLMDVLDDLPTEALSDQLVQSNFDATHTPVDMAVQFMLSHPAVASLIVDAADEDACAAATTKPRLPETLLRGLRHFHAS